MNCSTSPLPRPITGTSTDPFQGAAPTVMARNEAGHPSSVEPVTHEQVHAALLMFHEQARLCRDLSAWIDSSF